MTVLGIIGIVVFITSCRSQTEIMFMYKLRSPKLYHGTVKELSWYCIISKFIMVLYNMKLKVRLKTMQNENAEAVADERRVQHEKGRAFIMANSTASGSSGRDHMGDMKLCFVQRYLMAIRNVLI